MPKDRREKSKTKGILTFIQLVKQLFRLFGRAGGSNAETEKRSK